MEDKEEEGEDEKEEERETEEGEEKEEEEEEVEVVEEEEVQASRGDTWETYTSRLAVKLRRLGGGAAAAAAVGGSIGETGVAVLRDLLDADVALVPPAAEGLEVCGHCGRPFKTEAMLARHLLLWHIEWDTKLVSSLVFLAKDDSFSLLLLLLLKLLCSLVS